MKALIIEDELPSVRKLERLLTGLEIEVIDKLTSVKATVKWLKNNEPPNIIFMDVQLSDGLCFEIFEEVEIYTNIIFTTAYSDYSIKAFDYNGIFYLLKPIKNNELKKSIKKAENFHQKDKDLKKFKELKSLYKMKNYKTSFTVSIGSKIKIVNIKDINFLFSSNNATYLRANERDYIINYSLTNLENQLDPEQFFRVNRTYMVHINALKDIVAYTNSRLRLILHSYNETEIIVSRDRVKDFKNWIDR